MTRPPFFAILLVLASVTGAEAKTWYVGPLGDFPQIWQALQVAVDGDLLLVQPGIYEPFVLSKGVAIVATEGRFRVLEPVRVTGVSSGRAAISHMELERELEVRYCSAAVVLEDIVMLERPHCENATLPIKIANCDNVSISNLECWLECNFWPFFYQTAANGVEVWNSRVRIDQARILGGRGEYLHQPDGGHGIDLHDSKLVLSRSSVKGGDGTDYDPTWDVDGGDGGHGISASGVSEVIALGRGSDVIAGGEGGTAGSYMCGCGGGNGGDGIHSGSGVVSRVTVVGGEGGQGSGGGNGQDGVPYGGNITRDDRFPFLDVTARFEPGGSVSLIIDSTAEPGFVALLLADRTGFLKDPTFLGPPFAVLPGSWFQVLGLGHTVGGSKGVTGTLPTGAELQGFVLHLQGLVLADSGLSLLTNGVSRVIGD